MDAEAALNGTSWDLTDVPCPGCTGRFGVGTREDGSTVVHSLPWCSQFEMLETSEHVLAYLQRARAKAAASQN
jgi:hypothetical protein